jgi:hypothetical protein
MFVPPDAVSVGPLVVEKIDRLVDRTDQRLVPHPTRPGSAGFEAEVMRHLIGA